MQIIKAHLPKDHQIVLFGCTHMGASTRHNKAIRELVDNIATTKNMFAVHMGDAVEGITIDDKRFSLSTTDPDCPTPLKQAKAVIKEFTPIRKKLLTQLEGNHETHLHKFGNLGKYMCEELGIPFGTYTAKVHIYDDSSKPKLMYKMYLTHGRRSINSQAEDPMTRDMSEMRILKKHLHRQASDCLVMAKGHTHKLIICKPHPELLLHDDGLKVKQAYTGIGNGTAEYIPANERIYINTGSFLKNFKEGVTTYAEQAEYAPIELGYSMIKVENGKIVNAEKVVV